MTEEITKITTTKTLETSITYTVKGNIFIVEPVFQSQSVETLGDVLIRLMKAEIAS